MENLSRRNFLATAALAAPATLASGASAVGFTAGKPLKVCVFADIHYDPGVSPNAEDMSFLERIMARAEKEECDMMIHLGDFVHGVRSPGRRRS